MPTDSLSIAVEIFAIIGGIISVYSVIDNKVGGRRKERDLQKDQIADHQTRLVAIEKITGVVEEYMEDLLLESLKRK